MRRSVGRLAEVDPQRIDRLSIGGERHHYLARPATAHFGSATPLRSSTERPIHPSALTQPTRDRSTASTIKKRRGAEAAEKAKGWLRPLRRFTVQAAPTSCASTLLNRCGRCGRCVLKRFCILSHRATGSKLWEPSVITHPYGGRYALLVGLGDEQGEGIETWNPLAASRAPSVVVKALLKVAAASVGSGCAWRPLAS